MCKWLNLQLSMLKSQLTKKVNGETVAKSAATSCTKQDNHTKCSHRTNNASNFQVLHHKLHT